MNRFLIVLIPMMFIDHSAMAKGDSMTPLAATTQLNTPKVYTGGDGLRVTVARLSKAEPARALVQITGTDDRLDGVVLLHDIKSRSRGRLAFETTLGGEGFRTFSTETTRWSRQLFHVLHSEDGQLETRVSYDEKASAKASAKALLKAHREQAAKGTLATLQRFDRDDRIKRNQKALAETTADLAKACGGAFVAQVDWSTVTDEHFKTVNVSGYAEPPLKALRRLCEGKNGAYFKAQIQERVKKISIRFGARMNIQLAKDGTAVWTTMPGATNAGDFAYYNLMNLL